MALHNDSRTVCVLLISALALILYPHGECSSSVLSVYVTRHKTVDVLFTLFDKALQVLTSVGGTGLASQAYCQGSEDGTFPTAIMASDEIDQRPKLDFQVTMAHKIGTRDRLNNAVISRSVVCKILGFVLRCKLSSMLQESPIFRLFPRW